MFYPIVNIVKSGTARLLPGASLRTNTQKIEKNNFNSEADVNPNREHFSNEQRVATKREMLFRQTLHSFVDD